MKAPGEGSKLSGQLYFFLALCWYHVLEACEAQRTGTPRHSLVLGVEGSIGKYLLYGACSPVSEKH